MVYIIALAIDPFLGPCYCWFSEALTEESRGMAAGMPGVLAPVTPPGDRRMPFVTGVTTIGLGNSKGNIIVVKIIVPDLIYPIQYIIGHVYSRTFYTLNT